MKKVIVDIDGTISKVGERLKYLKKEPPDWDNFYEDCFEDEPIKEIINIVHSFHKNYDIIFCTGRRESVRKKTIKWLNKYNLFVDPENEGCIYKHKLLMRKNNDLRHDTISKPELLKEAGIKLKDIAFVLEDRNSMVKKWRSLGLICLQVADGDF